MNPASQELVQCLTEEGTRYTSYWIGLNAEEPRRHGVDFAVANRVASFLIETPSAINERLMTCRLPLARDCYSTFISAYAPIFPSDDSDKDKFYEDLAFTLSNIPVHDEVVLIGDFNARVGTDAAAWNEVIVAWGVGSMNENGLSLESLFGIWARHHKHHF